jgi:hypothetical protein
MRDGSRAAAPTRSALLLAAVALLVAAPAAAVKDWNRLDDPMQGGIGVHVGKLGGVGLAYKYPPVWWLNLQMAGGIWHTDENKRHNIGFEAQYLLRQDARLRLFLAAGAGFFYHKEVHDDRPDVVKDYWNTGFGIGVEWLNGDRFSIQLEGDFTHEGDDEDFIFLPQVGVFFYF